MILSLVGLPGAGKTTLGIALQLQRGWRHFELGRELRERGTHDPDLKLALSRGNLAPESVVLGIVRRVLDQAQSVLVLDGFPRHRAQLEVMLGATDWRLVWLDVAPELAVDRLARRLTCLGCGAPRAHEAGNVCERCGTSEAEPRPEDSGDALRRRIHVARESLTGLLSAVEPDRLVRIPAEASPRNILANLLARLE